MVQDAYIYFAGGGSADGGVVALCPLRTMHRMEAGLLKGAQRRPRNSRVKEAAGLNAAPSLTYAAHPGATPKG